MGISIKNDFGFEVKVIEDSFSEESQKRITTLQLRYPRFVHQEVMTHRQFSRNASSSRAIPVKKMIRNIEKFPARPVVWGTNNPGMQSKGIAGKWQERLAKIVWFSAAKSACMFARVLNKVGIHKQIVNRITEPFQFIDVVVTATEWDNFYDLRDHEDAQPEIRELARMMRRAMNKSVPVSQEVHLPYVSDYEKRNQPLISQEPRLLAMSIARCARVSYRNHDQSFPSVEKDLRLAKMLIEEGHMSPTEHQAFLDVNEKHVSGNFIGVRQLRHDAVLADVLEEAEKGA